jgi:hypothetical protein
LKVVHSFPHRVRDIENCWIPMSDRCRLAARVWLPESAASRPVPAILEYTPYRKRDGTRRRDEPMHRWFAGHGYACVRVDLRGSGDSDGILHDEYLPQEQQDGVEVIRWIAAQPWCSGRVGMIGKSWGGFAALQVAALAPPELGAVIAVCATDDRYADDAHYMGGCLLNENLIWGSVLMALNAEPPDPLLSGDSWRSKWLERLEHAELFPALWLRHPLRDGYWKQGSVGEDLARIRCPVWAVGGWADGYSNSVPRLLAGLAVPSKGLVGPWAHVYPHDGVPGPAIGFLQEAMRWWDHWLRGVENGVMDEPRYRVWMQDSARPRTFQPVRCGRWVAEDGWPSPRIEWRTLAMNRDGLDPAMGECVPLTHSSPESVGMHAGSWCGFGLEGEMPGDQRTDDAASLTFDGAPLAGSLAILGAPVVELCFAVDRPRAFVVVRLCEVFADGASTRVTFGLDDLGHREGHQRCEPLESGRRYVVRVRLNDVAHVFAACSRLRVAVSTCYWPMVWPAPERVALTVFTGESRLELPVRPERAEDDLLRPFAVPETAPPPESLELDRRSFERGIERDPATGVVTHSLAEGFDAGGDVALVRMPAIELDSGHAFRERFSIRDGDPLSARAEIEQITVARRPDWSVRVETRTGLWASRAEFHVVGDLRAFENGHCVFARSWNRREKR